MASVCDGRGVQGLPSASSSPARPRCGRSATRWRCGRCSPTTTWASPSTRGSCTGARRRSPTSRPHPATAIRCVQVDDAPAERPDDLLRATYEGRLVPGDGAADLVGAVRALDRIGYAGPLTVEVINAEAIARVDPVTLARRLGDADPCGGRARPARDWRPMSRLHPSRPGHRRHPERQRLRGLPRHRRAVGPPAAVHDVRPRRLLRQLAQPARD